jgi:hypothetical protein
MSQYSQIEGILSGRNELDDQYNSKVLFQFDPIQGDQNGTNVVFQIPQERIVVYSDDTMNLFPQVYKNGVPLIFNTDYVLTDPLSGTFTFQNNPSNSGSVPPQKSDDISCTFYWVWLTDIEWDRHLNRAANEMGFTQYYTGSSDVAGTEPLPVNGTQPTDIPDGLFGAIIKLGAAFGARALALRFSTKYDTSAGDQSFSPSQMAKSFADIAKTFEQSAYKARDDFYKGQGRQFRPAATKIGYILPNWTPLR